MRTYPQKCLCFILCIILYMGALASCGDSALPEESSTIPVEETSGPETEKQTETEVNTSAESEKYTDTAEEPTGSRETTVSKPDTSDKAPTVVKDDGKSALEIPTVPKGTYINPLTGLSCDEERAERRPVAIMLNNIAAALPQQNIAAADVLYECEVEGGLTRLLGVYNEYADLVAIGSVRSSREYYIDFAANHDAIYVHAGGSDEAYRNLKSRAIQNIDGVNGGAVTAYFYRDPVRRQTMSFEHTLVIDGTKLNEAIAYKKYRTTYSKTFANPLHFVGAEQTLALAGTKNKAEAITVSFGAHKTGFTYDAMSNTYLRTQNGNKHIDGVTDTQLAYENILILFCAYTKTNDDKNHITVSDVGSGSGYYITGGKYASIQWSKKSGDSPFVLTYPGGREVYLTPGKTNIEIVSSERNVAFEK